MIEFCIGIILLLGANYALHWGVKHLNKGFLHQSSWRTSIERIAYLPMKSILWVVGVTYLLTIISSYFSWSDPLFYLKPLRNASIVICLAWGLMRWKRELKLQVKGMDVGTLHILSRLASFIIILLTSLLILQIFDINILPLVAFGGVGAAAIGFAAKDVLANFFGGLMLHLTRPFNIGDWVILPDRQVEGSVEQVGWYFTSIRDKQMCPLYLPNAFFSSFLVINTSRRSHRRLVESIKIRYQDMEKAAAIIQEIKSYLAGHSSIDKNLSIMVNVEALQEYAIAIQVDAFCLTTRLDAFSALKHEILTHIYSIIRNHEADIALSNMIYKS